MSSEFNFTNLELRDSLPDGSQAAGLSHSAEGLVLLHVRELAADGEPRGALAVLHDAGGHGGRFEGFARFLAERGWAVTLPDLRGHGRSEGAQGHSCGFKEIERDVRDVLDHLGYMAPTASKVLVGQGLGGLSVLRYALHNPGELPAVVALCPTLDPRFEAPTKAGGLKGLFKKLGPESAGSLGWSAERRFADADARQAWSADPLVHDVITSRAIEAYLESADEVRARLSALEVPALIVCRQDDPMCDVEELLAQASDTLEVRVLPGAGHSPLHEADRSEVHVLVEEWLGARL